MKKFLLLILLFNINLTQAEEKINVLGILNEGFIGEQKQVIGVASELQKKSPSIIVNYISNKNLSEIRKKIQNTVILTSGAEGIRIISELDESYFNDKNTFVHISHLLFKNHHKIFNKANILAIPSGEINKKLKKDVGNSIIIETIGVPHDTNQDTIKEEYNKNIKQFSNFKKDDKIYLIMLGGDAILNNFDSSKNNNNPAVQHYTEEEAVKSAEYVGKLCKKENCHLLIFNGPRTGQYDPKTHKKIESAHKDKKLDYVTEAFVTTLDKFLDKSNFTLYNFIYKESGYFKAALYLLKNSKDSKIFVPGESTSTITEAIDNIEDVTILENNAMNKSHKKYTNYLAKIKAARVLDKNFHEVNAGNKKAKAHKPAAIQIAEGILEYKGR